MGGGIKKRVRKNIASLAASPRTLEAIYNLLFEGDGICAETYTGLERLRLTKAQVKSTVAHLAAAVVEATGQTDEYIGLYCDNRAEWICLFWAILKSGNKPYLINISQPAAFTDRQLSALGAKYTVYCGKAPALSCALASYDELLLCNCCALQAPFANEIVLSTSGTTLKEKLCFFTGEQLSAHLMNADRLFKRNSGFVSCGGEGIKVLAQLPLYHIFGLEAVYLWMSFFGGVLVFPPNRALGSLQKTVKLCGVTHLYAVPMLWKRIAQTARGGCKGFAKKEKAALKLQCVCPALGNAVAKRLFADVRKKLFGNSLRFCVTGGSAIDEASFKTVNAIGYPLYNGYGMTEIGIAAVDFEKRLSRRLPIAVGKPFDCYEFRVGADGCLEVKGAPVCARILADGLPAVVEGFLNTGDTAVIADDGRCTLTGRKSELVINQSGENINPQLVEQLIDLSGVPFFIVLGNEDNSALRLLIQLPVGMDGAALLQLYATVDSQLSALPARYGFEAVLYTYDSLTVGGIKPSREMIKRKLADGGLKTFPADVERANAVANAQRSELKNTLRGIMASVLEVPEERVTDNAHFMNELGGTSLDYMAVVLQIEKRFGISMQMESNGFGYTLNDFAAAVEEQASK